MPDVLDSRFGFPPALHRRRPSAWRRKQDYKCWGRIYSPASPYFDTNFSATDLSSPTRAIIQLSGCLRKSFRVCEFRYGFLQFTAVLSVENHRQIHEVDVQDHPSFLVGSKDHAYSSTLFPESALCF
uniref:Uncharacterized protein n=1 Tax=Schistocephalus solidus TaxID=70667 RepID=A0A0X3P926_SCHSO